MKIEYNAYASNTASKIPVRNMFNQRQKQPKTINPSQSTQADNDKTQYLHSLPVSKPSTAAKQFERPLPCTPVHNYGKYLSQYEPRKKNVFEKVGNPSSRSRMNPNAWGGKKLSYLRAQAGLEKRQYSQDAQSDAYASNFPDLRKS